MALSGTPSRDGGFVVTPEMRRLVSQPGYLSFERGGQRLRDLYQDQAMESDPTKLGPFAWICFTGQLNAVRQAVIRGTAPDLTGSETPYKFGYAALVVTGSQRVAGPSEHAGTLKFLLSSGAPPDVEDIVGYTALHHATMKNDSKLDLARILLENGADPNHRTKYGSTPILDCFQTNQADCADLLLEYGADLTIPDADGVVPAKFYLRTGPQIVAVVSKWERKRAGEEALLDEKRCKACKKTNVTLKQCAKCHTTRYCSSECQRRDWSVHKITCQPFNASNTVTVIPKYGYGDGVTELGSLADMTRAALGIPTTPTPARNTRPTQAPHPSEYPKSVVIKIQAPLTSSTAPLLVYTKKRDLVCQITAVDNPEERRRIQEVIREKGVSGQKAYFAAELKSKTGLVIKVGEVLAVQPF